MPHPEDRSKTPADQTGESEGKIKRPQQTDATMADKDLARRSEPATHNRR
ncbi:MAG TPA: hypothetical protein VM055_04895 [Novosphingobium sp.]|nr:hypothetical protein [Novosphingobium sp.]